jgi:hypothetical protein
VRNRVALKAARARAAVTSKLVRMSVVMALVPALVGVALTAMAQSAAASTVTAADESVAAEGASFGMAGPVGIAAVVVGFGGLIVGLLRHRRREAAAAIQVARQAVEQRAGERAA